MSFYISKIKLWFRNGTQPYTLCFQADKVNVITGASSTGKSSILKVIDYCLLQEHCNIVEDVINENVEWYGLLFYYDDKPYTIIRKAPTQEIAEMQTIYREREYMPDDFPQAGNDDVRAKVYLKLNKLFGFSSKRGVSKKDKIDFRSFLLFNYLTENIIASENTYLDTRFFGEKRYETSLDDLFKLIIGVDELKRQQLTDDLKKQTSALNRKQNSLKRQQEKTEKLGKNRSDIIQQLVFLDLYDGVDEISDDPGEWIKAVDMFLSDYDTQFVSQNAASERSQLTAELKELKEKRGYFFSLENEYRSYVSQMNKRREALEPIRFIEEHMESVFHFYETKLLIDALSGSLSEIKKNYKQEPQLPENFEKRKQELCEEIRKKESRLSELSPLDAEKQSWRWMHDVVELRERINQYFSEAGVNTNNIEFEIVSKEENIARIEDELKRLNCKNSDSVGRFNEYINYFYKAQRGISDSYSDCTPLYDEVNHSLMLNRDGAYYPIANIGSKSNYMFLHLCFFFGLHYLMEENESGLVLPFLFVDQPSIPYYANADEDSNIKSDDAAKLTEAFRLIDRFMSKITSSGKHFQIIMVEHASPDYWSGPNELSSFNTCAEFNRESGLIPMYAIKK